MHRDVRELVLAAAVGAIIACGPSAKEQAEEAARQREEAARQESAAKQQAAATLRSAAEAHKAKMAAWQAEQAQLAKQASSTKASKPAQVPQPARTHSMSARAWVNSGVRASLDQTTLEQFMAQVPTDVAAPSWTREGDYRKLTLVFNGGGRVIASFRASDVVGAGLVLYSVDVQD